MDLTLCEEAIDFENVNTGVFQLLKHVFAIGLIVQKVIELYVKELGDI